MVLGLKCPKFEVGNFHSFITRGYALVSTSVVAFLMQINHSLWCNRKWYNSQSHSKGDNRVIGDWLIFALVPSFFLHTRELKFQNQTWRPKGRI